MSEQQSETGGGVLGWIERVGNRFPDPVFIFFGLIVVVVLASVIAHAAGLSIPHPTQRGPDGAPAIVAAQSLLSPENLRRLFTEMPQTFTHFAPLGYVLLIMLGAGIADRTGLFPTAMRAAVRRTHKALLTPVVAFVGIISHHAADAGFVVLIPLAGVLYAAAGRHPILGIATAFAGVGGGFSANLAPGQLDALLFGITEAAAHTIAPGWRANIAGNWYFIIGMSVLFLPVIWFVSDRIIEPRLGPYRPAPDQAALFENAPLTGAEKRGLAWAGAAALAVIALWVWFTQGAQPVLVDRAAPAAAQMTPFYQSLIAGFFVLFLACGCAYGVAVGAVKSHRDIVAMMSAAMSDLSYYLVLAFAAAHFITLFTWSNLGLIVAVEGAEGLRASGLPAPVMIGALVLLSCFIDLFIGSASAKWAMMAPVLVPMMMLLGVSPEMTTAAYRVGDSVTNIVTPLMVYFPLVLTFCQRWRPDFGLGSLTATMAPYCALLLIAGLALAIGWALADAPLGPGASVGYALPR